MIRLQLLTAVSNPWCSLAILGWQKHHPKLCSLFTLPSLCLPISFSDSSKDTLIKLGFPLIQADFISILSLILSAKIISPRIQMTMHFRGTLCNPLKMLTRKKRQNQEEKIKGPLETLLTTQNQQITITKTCKHQDFQIKPLLKVEVVLETEEVYIIRQSDNGTYMA